MAIRKPFFVVPAAPSGMVCDSAESGHPVGNLARFDAIGLTWKCAVDGGHFIRGWFDDEQDIDFCSMISANAEPATQIRLRLGATQAEVDGVAPYDSTDLDFISPAITREDGLYHSHLELGAPVTATWFRIDITNMDAAFEAAFLVLGRKVTPARFYNLDFGRGVEDLGEGKFTAWGVFDEDPGLVFRTLDLTLGWLTEDEFEQDFQPMLRRLGTRGVIFASFDPELTTMRQSKTYMGVLKKPGYARGRPKPRTFSMDLSLLSMI